MFLREFLRFVVENSISGNNKANVSVQPSGIWGGGGRVSTAEVDAKKKKRARGRPKKNWMEGIKKVMNERNLNEGQWEDRKQWSLGVGQRRKTF
jgi:hypothetical protein